MCISHTTPFINMPSDYFQLFPVLGLNFLDSYSSLKITVSYFTFLVYFF